MSMESESAYTAVTAILHGSERIAGFAANRALRAATEAVCSMYMDRLRLDTDKYGIDGSGLPDELTLDLDLIGFPRSTGEAVETALSGKNIPHMTVPDGASGDRLYCVFLSEDGERAKKAVREELLSRVSLFTGPGERNAQEDKARDEFYRELAPGLEIGD